MKTKKISTQNAPLPNYLTVSALEVLDLKGICTIEILYNVCPHSFS